MFHALGMDIFVSDVPMMMRELHTDSENIQYLLAFFMFGTGIGQPFVGLLCDRYGRRVIILYSTVLFVVASLLAANVNTIFLLTALRFLQGLGACGTLVATYAIVNDTFHGRASYQMFSLIGCAIALTPMLAPMLGVGLTISFGTWKACFYFLAMFSMLALVVCLPFLPETRPRDTIVPTLSTFIGNYLSVAREKTFLIYTMCAMVALTQLFIYFSVGNILLIDRLGVSGFGFAFYFGLNAIVFLLGNFYSTILQKNLGAHRIIMHGILLMMAGSVAMLTAAEALPMSVASIIVPNGMMTFGVGLVMGPATGAALQPFKRLAGTASGLFATMQYCGAGLIGFVATRFAIHSAMTIAVPLLISTSIALLVLIANKSILRDDSSPEFV